MRELSEDDIYELILNFDDVVSKYNNLQFMAEKLFKEKVDYPDEVNFLSADFSESTVDFIYLGVENDVEFQTIDIIEFFEFMINELDKLNK